MRWRWRWRWRRRMEGKLTVTQIVSTTLAAKSTEFLQIFKRKRTRDTSEEPALDPTRKPRIPYLNLTTGTQPLHNLLKQSMRYYVLSTQYPPQTTITTLHRPTAGNKESSKQVATSEPKKSQQKPQRTERQRGQRKGKRMPLQLGKKTMETKTQSSFRYKLKKRTSNTNNIVTFLHIPIKR